jgi:hypothetical protein
MKKLLTSIVIVLVAMISFAQAQVNAESAHLTFKGVPVDGTLSEFILKMKNNGFTLLRSGDGIALLKGDFAAYKNCVVGVATLKQKDLVSKITVTFPQCDTWSFLSSDYFSLKEMLSEKYGSPSDCIEKFESVLEPEDDNSKMYEVKFDKCKYYSIYKTEKGSIQLSIEHDGVTSCFVQLAYFDKLNGNIIKAKAKDDL